MIRQLSPYEKTHLQRFGRSDIDINDYGEMPIEYITGKVEFGGHIFEINHDVLIPRVESGELINLALQEILPADKKKLNLADIGCGCGAIGISLWLELQKRGIEAELYLSDVSRKALSVAQKNVATLIGKSDKIHILQSDLLTNYPQNIKFIILVANLPYIPSDRIRVLDECVKEYEPHLALNGGSDGLKYIKKLVDQAKKKLNLKGRILLEVDYTHDEEFLRNNLNLGEFKLKTSRDQFQRTRFATISKN